MRKLKVDRENLKRNLELQKGLIVAEPLYVVLAALGHPNAHEKVRLLTLQAQREKQPLEELIRKDVEIQSYLEKMTSYQRKILSEPSLYTGIAAKKAKKVATNWAKKLRIEIKD